MRINKLIINGFKSFGDKTEIKFDENLIGIVGPNGSGKSNIIDAVRWVLGQQKMSELRTKSNTDVIFSGADNKAPKNVAEVTIIFDNEDGYLDIEYREVSITRRLFRTGENEYYINKNRCRLLDINNLILDKGFGKDSFSIISQGKVDEIIMSKPEERRTLIDEVAGISKYKYKKKITLNKLNTINENLEKIRFILEEIISRIEPLEKEKEKALKYTEIKNSLEEKETNLLANKIYNNKENIDLLKDNLLKISKEVSQRNANLKQVEEDIENIDKVISKNQIRINELNDLINNIKNKQIKYKNEANLLEQKMQLKEENNHENILHNVRNRLNSLQKEEVEMRSKKANIEPEKDKKDNKLKKLKDDLYIAQTTIYDLTRKIEELNTQNNRDKIPYHINKILELNNEEIRGTVGQNIEILTKYEVAINTILGNRKNEVIINTDNEVHKLIDYLKINKLGKVTFIPLNTIKPRFIKSVDLNKMKNSNVEAKIAIECVKYEKDLEKVMGSFLGNILIVNDVLQAQKIRSMLEGQYQIVTIDGDIFFTNGKVTGGYDKKNKYFKDYQKQEQLEVLLKETVKKRKDMLQEIESLTYEVSEINIQLELIDNKINTILEERKLLDIEYKEVSGNFSDEEENYIYNLYDNIKNLDDDLLKYVGEKNKKEKEIELSLENKKEKAEYNLEVIADYKVLIQEETEMKMKIEQLENETKEFIYNLTDKYGISFQKAYENSIKINDVDEYDKQVKTLKREIKDLGFVNLLSIEEYAVQKERLDFYSENEEDLLKAKQKVEVVINKIDNFVVQVFSDTFYKLNEEFKTTFEQLFDGGTAVLKMTNEDDILNTGIEIIARPPGKKSQIIGLLSGGEKALTAIALLFAILKIRVVPFSILDEVEAALDEANVIKYIEYLNVFSKRTQFILITHRQTTMERIDKLYGVTMIQKGVSSIIDIKLKEEENNV